MVLPKSCDPIHERMIFRFSNNMKLTWWLHNWINYPFYRFYTSLCSAT